MFTVQDEGVKDIFVLHRELAQIQLRNRDLRKSLGNVSSQKLVSQDMELVDVGVPPREGNDQEEDQNERRRLPDGDKEQYDRLLEPLAICECQEHYRDSQHEQESCDNQNRQLDPPGQIDELPRVSQAEIRATFGHETSALPAASGPVGLRRSLD